MTRQPIHVDDIRRIHYGYIVLPPGVPEAGQPVPVCGYLVQHLGGTILFDTGIAPFDEETRERYHPRVSKPEAALHEAGIRLSDIDVIANCHMHADHSGGNYLFPEVPVLVQRAELEAARGPDCTFPEYSYEYPGARLEVVDGDAEVAPGVRLIPTVGHSPGHQSLLVETNIGPLLLAGQAFNTASQFGNAVFSERLASAGLDEIGSFPPWIRRLVGLKMERAMFAHDLLVYERDVADVGQPQVA